MCRGNALELSLSWRPQNKIRNKEYKIGGGGLVLLSHPYVIHASHSSQSTNASRTGGALLRLVPFTRQHSSHKECQTEEKSALHQFTRALLCPRIAKKIPSAATKRDMIP